LPALTWSERRQSERTCHRLLDAIGDPARFGQLARVDIGLVTRPPRQPTPKALFSGFIVAVVGVVVVLGLLAPRIAL
jgi:hypothetical protein